MLAEQSCGWSRAGGVVEVGSDASPNRPRPRQPLTTLLLGLLCSQLLGQSFLPGYDSDIREMGERFETIIQYLINIHRYALQTPT